MNTCLTIFPETDATISDGISSTTRMRSTAVDAWKIMSDPCEEESTEWKGKILTLILKIEREMEEWIDADHSFLWTECNNNTAACRRKSILVSMSQMEGETTRKWRSLIRADHHDRYLTSGWNGMYALMYPLTPICSSHSVYSIISMARERLL